MGVRVRSAMASTRAPARPRCENSSVATARISAREVSGSRKLSASPRRWDLRMECLPDFAFAFAALTDSMLAFVLPPLLCLPLSPTGQNFPESRRRLRERPVRGPMHVHAKRLAPFRVHRHQVRKRVARHRELVDERDAVALFR